jgi:hypothetical protein
MEDSKISEAIPAAGELKNLALKYDARIGILEQQVLETRQGVHAVQEAMGSLAGMLEELRKPPAPEPKPEPPVAAPGRLNAIEIKEAGPAPVSMHVPAGSFGEATLLTGVYAPVSGDALPVLVRLDAVLTGPNRSRIPLQHAFLLGKAAGDANTSRAVVQLSTISVVGPDGTSRERGVNGYLVDADGIQGLRGTYVWNAQQLIGLSVLAGAATGAAGALGQGQTTTLIGPAGIARELTQDAALYVGAAGASRAFENVAKIIEERLKEFVPAVYVGNRARRVTVVFLQSATLEGIRPAAERSFNLGGLDR